MEVGGGGNSATEPYIVTKTVLLAHAKAVATYRKDYQETQNGQIGMTLNTNYAVPWDPENPDDVEAVDIST